MPHYLALFLCFLFSFFVYWIDSKRDKEVSPALWLTVLWMMLVASRSLGKWLNPIGDYDIDTMGSPGSLYDKIFDSVLMIAGLLVLFQRKSASFSKIFSDNIWLFVFYFYMGLSIFWAESADISFKRWIRTFGNLIMVLIVLTESNPLEAISKLFRRCFILLISLSVVLIRYFPNIGKQQSKHGLPDMWIGVSTHKNTLAQLLLIAGLYFLWDLIKNRSEGYSKLNIFYLIMIAYLLNGGGYSRSATCIILIVITVIIFVYLQRFRNNSFFIWKPVVGLVLLLFFISFLDMTLFNKVFYHSILNIYGKSETLTGRTDLWETLIPLGMKHPILGAGFGDFWNINEIYLKQIFPWGPGQSHNGYIDIFLNLGIMGLVLFAMVVFSAIKGALKQCLIDFDFGTIRITFLIVTLIHNYTESGFTRPIHLIWFTFLLFAVNVNHVNLPKSNLDIKKIA